MPTQSKPQEACPEFYIKNPNSQNNRLETLDRELAAAEKDHTNKKKVSLNPANPKPCQP
jgi:hypothetical protein